MSEGFGKSFNRKPRPSRKWDGESRAPARPAKDFGDRPPRKRDGEFGDRPPKREWTDRPSRKRDGEFGDRPPRREWTDRPPRKRDGEFGDRPPRREWTDRPPRKRDGEFGDRPPRREWTDRPPRPRPPKGSDDGFASARPARDFGDRPPRREWSDRPPRKRDGEFGDRPPRREWTDRPPRSSVPTHSREGSGFGSMGANDARREFGDRPMRLRRDREEINPNEGLSVRRPRLVVFGGSFDPVHRAHIELARRILDQDYGDEVMFMPAKQSPLKKPGQNATAQMRMEMLNLAIADALAEKPKFTLVKKPPRWAPEGTPDEVTEHEYVFSCSDLELERPGENSYTYDTLCTLQKAFPEKQIIFLMGTDKLEEIPRWYRYTELIQQFDFMIYPRPGFPASPFFLMAERYGDAIAARLCNSLLPNDVEKFPQIDLSSTEVRNALAAGEDVSQFLLPSVLQYIKDHQLYQSGQEAQND